MRRRGSQFTAFWCRPVDLSGNNFGQVITERQQSVGIAVESILPNDPIRTDVGEAHIHAQRRGAHYGPFHDRVGSEIAANRLQRFPGRNAGLGGRS